MASFSWLVGADFNEILWPEEKLGGVERSQVLINNFRAVLDDCELGGLGFSGDQFTWCNNRSGLAFVQERLDGFVSSLDWRLSFPNTEVVHLEYWGSDHRPLLLYCGGSPCSQRIGRAVHGSRRSRFHFEECWIGYSECSSLIQKNWGVHGATVSFSNISSNIRRCAQSLQVWNNDNLLHLRNKISKKRLRLQSLNASKELDVLLYKEEIYWRQKARTQWLQGGDKNNRFFHRSASNKKARNKIDGLLNSAEVWVNSRSEIIGCIQDYFKPLFSSFGPSSSAIDRVTSCMRPRVTSRMNALLDAPFNGCEVKATVLQMSPSKAPGKDRMPARFFQTYWDTVGAGVTQACLNFLNSGGSVRSINGTLIALILKIKAPKSVADFLPISLCNVIYKIVSKVLVNRFCLVLDEVISTS
ncbi:hypothetical protein ACOSP7_010122 [Xanthoceras sorbifolium]